MRRGAVFPDVDALPGAEGEFTVHDGEAQVHRGQRGADVRGHVVAALAGVLEERVAIRGEPGEEALQVAADFRVGVFLDEQRSGGVPEMQRGEAGLQAGLAHAGGDFMGDFSEAAAARGDDKLVGAWKGF